MRAQIACSVWLLNGMTKVLARRGNALVEGFWLEGEGSEAFYEDDDPNGRLL